MIKILFEVLSVIFPVISITALGYFWNKIGNTINQKEIIKFIAWVGAPCLVFDSLINLDSTYSIVSSIAFGAVIMIFGMLFISFALLKIYNLNIKTYINPMIFVNSGNIGITICLFAFGDIGLEIAIIYFATSSILNFTLGVSIWSGKFSPKILLKTPILFSVIIVILFHINNITVPSMIDNTISLLAGATIPLLLFSMGISLANIKLNIDFKIISLIILRSIIAIFLAYCVTIVLGLEGIVQNIIIMQALLPAALFNFLFASEHTNSSLEVANYVMLSTIISILTISIFLFIIL